MTGGVDVLVAGLRARGIDPAVFVGKGTTVDGNKVTGISRQQGIKDYMGGKKRVIVLSGAGAEGLDLKNSTAFYSLDGHFNPERIIQAEGAGKRLEGLLAWGDAAAQEVCLLACPENAPPGVLKLHAVLTTVGIVRLLIT